MDNEVLFEVKEAIATITLNRPERKNAINQALLTGLYNGIERIAKSAEIKVGIITGSGSAFCSGIDLACLSTDKLFDPRSDGNDMPKIFSSCNKPIIGAVNGYAITGGFEIALNCDFLIASENAVFADTHAKVGIHPGWGMSQLLQQAVGQRLAKQFSSTCEKIPAQRALACGLVNEVVPADKLLARAFELAEKICEVNYDMMLTIKTLIEAKNRMTFNNAMAMEQKGFEFFLKDFGK
ncbi:MAG: enoyl-CoA hydratase [Deltaproteobacteria bacterium]|uniref:enoyl-CoA hydratase n=1 Tax=Desulfobacula sp. TaxID=2593537 RepID=UPI0019CBB392|nr:enoyl-CoA hydratase [Candidatus Desulfobacula maris]MBL6995319.1 enoyl-CoA hydratase [Desulfobacula sp.]